MRQMKNHSPEIDFSFSCKRFSVCRKMINHFHTSLFLSNLPIYPKEQSHAISSRAILKRQTGHSTQIPWSQIFNFTRFSCRICYDIRT